MSQVSPVQQLPLDILGVATVYQLGTPQKVYGPAKGPLLYRFIGIFSIVLGCLINIAFFVTYDTYFTGWPRWQAILIPLVGAAWLLLGVWMLLSTLLNPRTRVYLCPEGLIYVRHKTEVIRWNQIERIWKDVNRDSPELNSYVIRRSDDALFTFSGELERVEELGQRLEEEVTRRLLPRAIAAYEAGGPVGFEEIIVTPRGVGVKGGTGGLPWDEFNGISIDDISINIYRKGGDRWATVKTASVPNAAVLKRLVAYIRREHARAQLPQVIAYNAGLPVSFGALVLSKQGIDIENGKVVLPWSEVVSIGVGEQEVVISRKGAHQDWYALPTWRINDVVALRELVEYIMR